MRKEGFRKKRITIPMWVIVILVFILSSVYFNNIMLKNMIATNTFYAEADSSSFPIIYQKIDDKKVNLMRAYRDENYMTVSNETLSVLGENRTLDLIIEKNGATFQTIEYEIRDKNSKVLIEKTALNIDSKDELINVTLNIQNLIVRGNTYTLVMKIDLVDKRAYYFTNIIYKKRDDLQNALNQVKDFTEKSFDKQAMTEYVKYLETSPNRDTRQLFNVNLQSSYEQITWADTNMKLSSDLLYKVYQAQDYCFNIDVNYLATCVNNDGETEKYLTTDQYVIRWDESRFYFMKFNRHTDEIIDLNNKPFYAPKHRFYLGVTDLSKIQKIESPNKEFFAVKKAKEIFMYDNNEKQVTNIYSNRITNSDTFLKTSQDYDIKIIDVTDEGNVEFLVYGYNMRGNNEGYLGLSYMTYDRIENKVNENFFVPIFTTYQNLKYDLSKLCQVMNEQLYFKTYDRVYAINKNTKEMVMITEKIDETRSAASSDGNYLAYNVYGEETNNIIIMNFMTNKQTNIKASEEGELIEVITCMNDDLFYGVTKATNLWMDGKRIIGRPFDRIQVINMRTNEEKVFNEENVYFYNFVTSSETLRYNKYLRNGNSFRMTTNGVIINNYEEEDDSVYLVEEEWTNEKLRIAYIMLDTGKEELKFNRYTSSNLKLEEVTPLEKEMRVEPDIYYVYNNGNLVSKRKVLTDAVSEIRDSFGYVKLNDSVTCYNRSNKANVSYLRKNDNILENLEGFEENFYLKENAVLVMNVTGVTERDLEYYISMGEKLAVFNNNEFQYFVTGYDNNNYVLEYLNNHDRILTPRSKVHEMIVDENYIVYAQLEKLE